MPIYLVLVINRVFLSEEGFERTLKTLLQKRGALFIMCEVLLLRRASGGCLGSWLGASKIPFLFITSGVTYCFRGQKYRSGFETHRAPYTLHIVAEVRRS